MEQLIDEIWKPVKVNPNYLVSNYGRIKTIDHPIWCKVNNSYSIRKGHLCVVSNSNSKGYWRVGIQVNNKQKHFAVHRLVALAFIPNPQNLPQINHIDGNKDNNHVSNLEWCDNTYNQQHAIEHGLKSTIKMSQNAASRKLTEDQVSFIRYKYNSFDFTQRGTKRLFCLTLCKMFNLSSENTIQWIITGKTTKYISQDIVQTTNLNLWNNQFNTIYNNLKDNKKKFLREYAEELNVNPKTFMSYYIKCQDLQAAIAYYQNKSLEKDSSKEIAETS